jgi:hypothetical protein
MVRYVVTEKDYDRRRTLHDAKLVRTRSGMHVCHGEPRCSAPNFPGSTTVIEDDVTCDECLDIRERAAKAAS